MSQTVFQPADPNYDSRVRNSFHDQVIMQSMGITLEAVDPGQVTLGMLFNPSFVQQHGFHHAGATTTALDSACGYAAMSLMPADAEVLTVEFKVSLMAPAAGERFSFVGRVIKPGRTLIFTEGEAVAHGPNGGKVIATMTATMMVVQGRAGINR
ncbi:PaaI family thioesterase [Shimia ponticola]|uniref:PaaI family thioesterase n=1 Tax=Shimia ponticola TaxID=2582893 RepID=UPI0011BDC71B|nr:PaaI family thioesterase [Shimia ponticola]